MQEESTRTILVTDFPKNVSHAEILKMCRDFGEVRDHYTMQSKSSVLFISFYDIRSAEKAAKAVGSAPNESFKVKYSIAMCEVPKGTDACTEDKNQGSVCFAPNPDIAIDSEKVWKREKRGSEQVVQFYDTRDAVKFFEELRRDFPRSNPRLVWDNDLRKRRSMLQEAEEVVKNASVGFYSAGAPAVQESAKRAAKPHDQRKKAKTLHWMVSLFDRYISDHPEMAKYLKY